MDTCFMFIEAVAQNAARGWEKFPDAMVKTGTFPGDLGPFFGLQHMFRTHKWLSRGVVSRSTLPSSVNLGLTVNFTAKSGTALPTEIRE